MHLGIPSELDAVEHNRNIKDEVLGQPSPDIKVGISMQETADKNREGNLLNSLYTDGVGGFMPSRLSKKTQQEQALPSFWFQIVKMTEGS